MSRLPSICIGLVMISSSTAYGFTHNEKLVVERDIRNITFSAEVDHRYEGDDIFYRHYDAGVEIPLSFMGEGWSTAANYRSVYNKSDGKWNLEKRPHMQIQKTFNTSESGWLPELKWGIRTRQEYRIRENGNHTSRNRSRVTVKSNKEFFNVKPFISNEVFYDFDEKAYSTYRVDIGAELPQAKGMKPSLYYKLMLDRNDQKWAPTSSIVFKLVF